MNKSDFKKLCIKELSGNISDAEKQLLNNWLSKSDENRKELEKFKSAWNKISINEINNYPDIDLEWNRLNERIRLAEKGKENKKASVLNIIPAFVKSFFTPKWKPAFTLLFLLISTAVVFYMFNKDELVQYKTISTLNTEHKTIDLVDGSIITLNSGSAIKYPDRFNNEIREVTLEGEGFFSIAKNEKPFIINTKNAKITVLGTQFNVWSRNEQTRVLVKEGKVNLVQKSTNGKGVNLVKGELSTVIKDSKPSLPENVDTDYLLGWMENKLVFNKTSLIEITGELERFFNVRINLENDSLKNYKLSGSFEKNKIDTVLSMICLALELKYSKQQGIYIIKTKM